MSKADSAPPVVARTTAAPSAVAESLAAGLACARGVGSEVYWGNDGFCIDLALRHPVRPDDVTIGVLCDGTRFPLADDPVEWDVFRTTILESQGWTLHRLWTPILFRDPRGVADDILREATESMRREVDPAAIPVPRDGESP